jgi:hypothetical protein
MRIGMVSALAGAAVAVAATAATGTTPCGIRGTVTRSPITPVCRAGTPCSAPAAGLVLVVLARGERVATVTTSAAGTYRVVLRPGTYVLRSLRRSTFGSLPPRTVRVTTGRFTVVNVTIDTGIR